MGYALKYTQELETHTCGTCGIEYAAPEAWWKAKRDSNGSFTCPNGDVRSFVGESAQDKINRLTREKQAAEDAKDFAERRLSAEKLAHQKELKRRDKRDHAGVCQHCHRTFKQLAAHMKSKHESA